MKESKSYDGNSAVVHIVQRGESLSKIAGYYRLPNWQAIWLYNTKVNRVYLGNDPDVISTGERLLIPRSPAGYDRLVKKLGILRLQMESAGDQEQYALDAHRNSYKAWETGIDFVGDVATTLATFGLKANEVLKASKVAKNTTGSGKVAAEYLYRREGEKFAELLRDTLKDKAIGGAATKFDEYRTGATGKETTIAQTTHTTYSTGKKVVSAVTGFSMIAGKALLDVAEIALDYVSPSKVANACIWLATGETVEGTMDRMSQQVKAIVKRSVDQLDAKIATFADERDTVYPPEGSTIGRYVTFPPLHITVPRRVK